MDLHPSSNKLPCSAILSSRDREAYPHLGRELHLRHPKSAPLVRPSGIPSAARCLEQVPVISYVQRLSHSRLLAAGNAAG